MQKRKLGRLGLKVSALGLGCMGMSYAYGPSDQAESLRVLDRALELGINFFDTAEVYGPFKNEELIGGWLKNKSRDSIVIATKFGFTWDEKGVINGVNSKPKHIRQSIEDSLKRLKTDYIDLYYQHRLDPATPIEDTMGTLSELVKEGKICHIGLSEVGPGIIRRAHIVHPITALQSEYSLWDRNVEETILPLLRDLEIGFVPFSPLGRGFLSGKIHSKSELDKSDFRQSLARFEEENLRHNYQLIELLKNLAANNNTSPAQIALAWLLRQDESIVPIPGTRHVSYLEENCKAVDLFMPESEWSELSEFLATFKFQGARYPDKVMQMVDRTP